LIDGIPIATTTVLSATLAVGNEQLAQHKAIVALINTMRNLYNQQAPTSKIG
jgi:hypothetical protein